jgi:hypothetical protein
MVREAQVVVARERDELGAGTDRARRRAALGDYEPPPQLPALERGELVARDVV